MPWWGDFAHSGSHALHGGFNHVFAHYDPGNFAAKKNTESLLWESYWPDLQSTFWPFQTAFLFSSLLKTPVLHYHITIDPLPRCTGSIAKLGNVSACSLIHISFNSISWVVSVGDLWCWCWEHSEENKTKPGSCLWRTHRPHSKCHSQCWRWVTLCTQPWLLNAFSF